MESKIFSLLVGILAISPVAFGQDPVTWLNGTVQGTPIFVQNPNFADAVYTVPQLIRRYGYPCEEHTVTTSDGYILSIHRIPYGVKSPQGSSPRPVAFLQHGLVSSSAQWVINHPENSLAYILADAGYDVWMLNFRGNTYSLGHTTYNSSDFNGPYWKFSFHENGKYDLPTAFSYVLANTTRPNLTYVGHSMGTTAFFIAMSLNPALNAKVNLFVAMAPIVYLTHTQSPLRALAPLVLLGITQEVAVTFGPGKFNANNNAVSQLKSGLCVLAPVADLVCASSYFVIQGFDQAQFNNSQIPVYNANYPAGSSLQTFAHYGQWMNAANFAYYNNGYLYNLLNYGSLYPPSYNLASTTVPTALYTGANDWLSDPTDVEYLVSLNVLPNIVKNKQVNFSSWNHVDFSLAIDAVPLLYNDVVALMATYNTFSP